MSEAGKRLIAEAQRAREKTREPIYARRRPAHAQEELTVQREGPHGFWHARDDRGNLVAVHQYQNDLMPGLEYDGFKPTMVETTYGLCEECHEAPAIGLTRDGRYLCDGCLFQEETR